MNKYTPEKRIAKFWSRVDRSGGDDACWEWQGGKSSKGYGETRWGAKQHVYAHRIAWTLTHNDPGDLHVLHSCDNPPCCNPKHLSLGTNLDNMRDKTQKRRGNQPKGERQSTSKLTADAVVDIRTRYAAGDVTLKQLATEYSVSIAAIESAVKRKTWASIS